MEQRAVIRLANRIERVSSPGLVNDFGRRIGFRCRGRPVVPYRPVPGLLAGHATGPVETLAGVPCDEAAPERRVAGISDPGAVPAPGGIPTVGAFAGRLRIQGTTRGEAPWPK